MIRYQPCAAYQGIDQFLAHDIRKLHGLYAVPTAMYGMLRDALRQAHTFVFDFSEVEGHISETTAVAQFTADCLSEGLFQPPFDVTLLQWPDPPNGFWRYAAALILTLRRNGCNTTWGNALDVIGSKFGTNVRDGGCLAIALGFGVQAKEDQRICYLQDFSILMSYQSGQRLNVSDGAPRDTWTLDHVAAVNVFSVGESKALNNSLRDAGVTVRNLFYYMGILSSRGPRTRLMAPEPRVAQKRAKEGRAPWTSYSLISLPQQGAGHASSGNGTGERSSPRQHWRRGHIRHLPSGKTTVVVPCMVGMSELGKVIASYQVGKEHAT